MEYPTKFRAPRRRVSFSVAQKRDRRRDENRKHDQRTRKWEKHAIFRWWDTARGPPPHGDLQRELERLATTAWRHPITSAPTRFGLSTIERWYYEAKNAPTDPVGRLRKKLRKDLGRRVAITDVLKQAIHAQYDAHRSWSYQLHYDNLVAWAEADRGLGRVPAYATVRRYMK